MGSAGTDCCYRTKIGALVLALVMVLAMSSTAFATGEDLTGGEFGGFTSPDSPVVKERSINIVKDIVVYNPNGDDSTTTVHSPVITYTYTVSPASVSSLTVTDDTSDHSTGLAVQVPVNAGLTTGLVVTGANAAGTAVAGSAGDASSASATLVFDNTSTWVTDDAGHTNSFDINLSFAGVSFTQPGVYRYQIVETTSSDLDDVAMVAGSSKTRYLDVYVAGNDSDSDGKLDIYGYVCMETNASVTTGTTKTNGFVAGSNGADSYYTYDLVVSKDVVNDTYGEAAIAFPYTIIFSNPENYTSTFTIGESAASGSTGISPAAASAPTWSGVARVKDGANITYTGIPAGVHVTIYETNIATGVTYSAQTNINGSSAGTADNPVVSGSLPATAVAQTSKGAAESTAYTVDTTAMTTTTEQTFEIVNTLQLISPTGVVLRIAPYALMLGAGIVLLLITRRRKEDAAEA